MRLVRLLAPSLLAASTGACGYSEAEWKAQLDKYTQLREAAQAESITGREDAVTSKAMVRKQLQAELTTAQERVVALAQQLAGKGVDVNALEESVDKTTLTMVEQASAFSEYKLRARQREVMKGRLEALETSLAALGKPGVAITVRNNRAAISLPGDLLFEPGKPTLKKEGKALLAQVAGIIKADGALQARSYQVAGHTDSKPPSGGAQDNMGLSLMRAREALLFLVDEGLGGLPASKWSAAGYGHTDPVASNDTDEGRQQNRRCEIVFVPNVAETLDLRPLAR